MPVRGSDRETLVAILKAFKERNLSDLSGSITDRF